MASISVYEPPGCCSSGVCGPEVEESMAGFAAALAWAKKQGVDVAVYNLGYQPAAFVENTDVRDAIDSDGMECLPLVMAGDKIISKGVYLSKEDLVEKAGLEISVSNGEEDAPAPKTSCCG
jgi:hypothetical protein